MAEVILEVIANIFFESIPRYFGALLKWVYLKFTIPFSEILEKKGNATIGGVALGIIILVLLIVFNL